MGIPVRQVVSVGAYVVRQHLAGRKRYPLVLMLEPLFQCNLACAGCGKIDYPDPILKSACPSRTRSTRSTSAARRSSSWPAGSRCFTRNCRKIVAGVVARKKFAIVCTNALLLEKKIDQYRAGALFHLVDPSRRRREAHDSRYARRASTSAPSQR